MADEDNAPRNRRDRRAAAKDSGQKFVPMKSVEDIAMRQPDRSGPKGKTLFQIADERQELIRKGQPFDMKHGDGLVRDEDGNILLPAKEVERPRPSGEKGTVAPSDDPPIGKFGDAVFFTLTLAMLHFTLDVLVYQQYRQEIAWDEIFKRTLTILPVLFFIIYTLRSDTADRWPLARQIFCLGTGVIAGCYLIHIGNNFSYYFVMQQAPPVGTLWVWSVIEMGLPFALASLGMNGVYLWWNGYTVF